MSQPSTRTNRQAARQATRAACDEAWLALLTCYPVGVVQALVNTPTPATGREARRQLVIALRSLTQVPPGLAQALAAIEAADPEIAAVFAGSAGGPKRQAVRVLDGEREAYRVSDPQDEDWLQS